MSTERLATCTKSRGEAVAEGNRTQESCFPGLCPICWTVQTNKLTEGYILISVTPASIRSDSFRLSAVALILQQSVWDREMT